MPNFKNGIKEGANYGIFLTLPLGIFAAYNFEEYGYWGLVAVFIYFCVCIAVMYYINFHRP